MAKNPHAVALGRLGGLKGGPARAAALAPSERSRQSREAVQQRWRNRRLADFLALLKTSKLLGRARILP